MTNDSMWMLPLGKDQQEIKLEGTSNTVPLHTVSTLPTTCPHQHLHFRIVLTLVLNSGSTPSATIYG
jgi:hypothetical protein